MNPITQWADQQINLLDKSVKYEQMKSSFIAMFQIVDVVMTEDENPPIELCEDYLKALKVYNQVTGENHTRARIQELVNKFYNIP